MQQTSMSVIKDMFTQMKSAAEASRKADIQTRRYYLEDDFKHLIVNELKNQFVKETYDSINLMPDDSINLVQFVTDEIGGGVYQYEAKRAFQSPASKEPDARYAELIADIPMDIIMDEVCKGAFALNEFGVGVAYRGGKIQLDIFPPDYVTVWQDENDPLKIKALMYEVILSDTADAPAIDSAAANNSNKRYFVWWDTDGNHFMFDEHFYKLPNPDNPDNVNPYKDAQGNYIIPFVICHKKYNPRTIWDGTSGNKLYSAQTQICVLSTLFNYYAKVLSLKQLAIVGTADVKAGNDQLLDPLHIFKVEGEGASISVLDMQGRLDMFEKNVIVGKIERALNSEGLSLESFNRSGNAESGYKLKIKKEGQLKRINSLMKFFRVYEKQIADIMRIVNNTYFDKKIAEDAVFSIDFAEYTPQENPLDVDKHREFELLHNLKTELDFIREDNPDIEDDEAARKKWDENKAVNDGMKNDTGAINGAVNNAINDVNGNGIPDEEEDVGTDTE